MLKKIYQKYYSLSNCNRTIHHTIQLDKIFFFYEKKKRNLTKIALVLNSIKKKKKNELTTLSSA